MDDLVILFPKGKESNYQDIHNKIKRKYNIKFIGELRWFLGIKVIRNQQEGKL